MPMVFPVVVDRVVRVTPSMVRITFGGVGLDGYATSGEPDEYCKVLFPHPGSRDVVIPPADGEELPAGVEPAPQRNYTIRRFDPDAREVDIDFVVHDGGIAATWAQQAAPGDHAALTVASGRFEMPPAGHRLVLVGDATALPAIGRIVESMEPGRHALVVGVVAAAEEEQVFRTAGEVEYRWVHVPLSGVGEALRSAVEGLPLPDGQVFVWMAGESEAQRAVRKHLRHVVKLPSGSYSTMGYWRFAREEWEERYEQVKAEIVPTIEKADKEIADDEEFFDALDEIYDKVGL
ncbi:MAG: hypothetical protein ABS81_03085 [Pseudonocardia sp. SCN 72-86]|nr:MAG: hypothetical protein ABS81_03085 [Pseudonocardia sp. SCN 72-86]